MKTENSEINFHKTFIQKLTWKFRSKDGVRFDSELLFNTSVGVSSVYVKKSLWVKIESNMFKIAWNISITVSKMCWKFHRISRSVPIIEKGDAIKKALRKLYILSDALSLGFWSAYILKEPLSSGIISNTISHVKKKNRNFLYQLNFTLQCVRCLQKFHCKTQRLYYLKNKR